MYWHEATETVLAELAAYGRLGLVSDVDGTLSPIVADPDQAQVTPRNRELLAELQEHCTLVAVISGRAAPYLHAMVGVDGLVYVGNHGFERWEHGQVIVDPGVAAYRHALEAAQEALRPRLEDGMRVEDKGATLSLHYRQTSNPDQTAARFRPIAAAIATRHGLRLTEGRKVFELRPPLEVDKGSAFTGLIRQHQLEAALYLGDDTTDVAALKVARGVRERGECYAWGVGVESEETPEEVLRQADLLAEGVAGVEALLAWLLKARKASST